MVRLQMLKTNEYELAMLLQKTPVQTMCKSKENVAAEIGEQKRVVGCAKCEVPIWEKSNLTLEEAAAYCGIGITKLRELSDVRNCTFVLWNGNKRLLKRRKLDEFLDREYSI